MATIVWDKGDIFTSIQKEVTGIVINKTVAITIKKSTRGTYHENLMHIPDDALPVHNNDHLIPEIRMFLRGIKAMLAATILDTPKSS